MGSMEFKIAVIRKQQLKRDIREGKVIQKKLKVKFDAPLPPVEASQELSVSQQPSFKTKSAEVVPVAEVRHAKTLESHPAPLPTLDIGTLPIEEVQQQDTLHVADAETKQLREALVNVSPIPKPAVHRNPVSPLGMMHSSTMQTGNFAQTIL